MPRKGSGVAHRSFTPFHESALANLCHGAVRGQNVCGQETVEARNRVRAAETELKQCTEVAFARACARARARAVVVVVVVVGGFSKAAKLHTAGRNKPLDP